MNIPSEPVPKKEPIAIIGIGCRFPGGANNPENYWKLLVDGVDAITEVPADRWNMKKFYDQDPAKPGKTYARWGGFVENIDQFDPQFFGISPREAAHLDPQQRMLLELVWEALEDGGQVPEHLAGSNTGVFVGTMALDFQDIQLGVLNRDLIDAQTGTGVSMSIVANRISYVFDFKGPSIALDTACSSSLVAIHLACQSIWNGESTLAVAGGVSLMLRPEMTMAESKATMLSPDGRCKSFDARANGYVRGEGAGIVVLKRLSTALADRDPIYAVIRGIAINQDGHTNGITVPNGLAQEVAIREVLQQTGVSPQQIQYVEAHGTGTAVGDPIEANTLGTALGRHRPVGNDCIIGSVKSNFGHLEAGAGIAGLTKVALALTHRQIPPNLHFETPNPKIPFEELRLRVPTRLEPWPENDNGIPRLAGVNSFGFGGTNAHVLLAEAPDTADSQHQHQASPEGQTYLLPVSARSPEALQAYAQAYKDFLTDEKSRHAPLSDICYSASLRRSHHNHRLALVAHSKPELVENLEAFLVGENRLGLSSDHLIADQSPKLALVFSGMGQQWWAMGRQLLEKEPVFRETIEQCDALLRQHTQWSLLEELTADEEHSRINETQIAQPAIFAVQVALAALWRSWGIVPKAIVGHSVGEVAAAHVAGILSLEEALQVVFHRSRLQAQTAGQGKMLAVGLSSEEVAAFLVGHEEQVSIGAINSLSGVTLSGNADILEKIAQLLEQKEIFARFLRVEVPYHSPLMEPLKAKLIDSLQTIKPKTAQIPLFSTVTGKIIEGSEINATYWAQNIREPVLFATTINGMIQADYNLFLEIGAHPVLSTYISEILTQTGHEEGRVFPSLRRKEPEQIMLLGSFGKLYTVGYAVDWHKLYPQSGCFVRLPAYPWQRERYWHESEPSQQDRLGDTIQFGDMLGKKVHPLLGSPLKSAHLVWNTEIDLQNLTYFRDHKIRGAVVCPGVTYVEMALAAAKETFGEGTYVVEEVAFQKPLFLPENEPPTLQLILEPSQTSFDIYSLAKDAEKSWVKHATGKLSHHPNSKMPQPVRLDEILRRCPNEISIADFYQKFHELGFELGSYFQRIERLWQGDGEALGQFKLPKDIETEIDDYLVHPTILDACTHVMGAAVRQEGTYIPIHIDRLFFYSHPQSQQTLWSYVRLLEQSATRLKGDIQIFDEAGNVLVDIQGFRGQQSLADVQDIIKKDDYFYEYQWQLQDRPSRELIRSADYLPSPLQIAERLQTEAARLNTQLDRPRYYEKIKPQLNDLSIAYILKAFQNLGWEPQLHQRVSVDSLAEQLNVISPFFKKGELHHHLLSGMFNMLKETGILTQVEDDQWEVTHLPAVKNPQALWQTLLGQYPAYQAELMLIGRCGQQLAEILRGEVEPLPLLFPPDSTISEHFYQDAPSFRIYNQLVQKTIAETLAYLPTERTLRILEIGAGTGGITSYILPKLPTYRTEYLLTDVSEQFISQAKQKFHDYHFVQYQLLDIEADPVKQGLEAHSYDVILISNTLYAVRDVRQTLTNIKTLLASEGRLVLLELTNPIGWLSLIFGLVKPSHLRFSSQKWQEVLEEAGFSEVVSVSDTEQTEDAEQTVFLAKGQVVQPESQPVKISAQPGNWLIFADKKGIGQKLATLLKGLEEQPILISVGETYQHIEEAEHFQLRPTHPEDMQQLLKEAVGTEQPTCRGIVHLWGIDTLPLEETTSASLESAQTQGCISVLHLVQALEQMGWNEFPPLWLVTQGLHTVGSLTSVSGAQAPLWGLGRVIITEQPNLNARLVDISPECSSEEIQSFFEELLAVNNPVKVQSSAPLRFELRTPSQKNLQQEEEIALRGEARYVHRLIPVSPAEMGTAQKMRHKKAVSTANQPFHLENATPGVLDNLILRAFTRQPPALGKVELQVCATSLNFKDVVKAMNRIDEVSLEKTYFGQSLGIECAGKITAIGEGVEGFQIGDEVMGLAPHSFSTHTTTDACFVVPKPTHLNFEEAATIPLVFWTAYYALHTLGNLKQGERILIHAASGGVGLFAIHIAQRAGAEIFATAGNAEKRQFLQLLGVQQVMDSRTLTFADEIRERTNGEGVDIVLNALPGNTIVKSMSLLKPRGRFIDISNIYSDSQLGLRPFQKGLSFFAFDLDQLMQSHRDEFGTLFREALQYFTNNLFHPLPYRLFPVSEMGSAFRYMAQAKHIGKIVVSLQEPDVVVVPSYDEETVTLNADGTYLLTGGLSGFGLATAQWLVERGARHLVLMGRRGASSPEAKQAIEKFDEAGVKVTVAKADVTQEQQVAKVLADIRQSMPPLRGIIHAANVYDDAVLTQLNEARMKKVMAPKMIGAWNLHTQTLNTPLDFFVLFSSVASTIGNQGQGNYVAANAFLDALAHYRQAKNLPVLTVNWGAIDVGYVSQNTDLVERFNTMGIKILPVQQALKRLGELLQLQAVQTVVTGMDWQLLGNRYPTIAASPRFSHLVGKADLSQPQPENEAKEDSFSNLLLAAAPAERQLLLESRIGEQVAQVLGTSATKLDIKQPLISMGLDSLTAVELSHGFKRELGVDMPTMKLLGGTSIAQLTTQVNEQLTESQSVSVATSSQDEQQSTSIERDKERHPENGEDQKAMKSDWVEGEL